MVNPAFTLIAVFLASATVYSLHVHIMANLVLVHGSSWKKSIRTGAALGLILSSYIAFAAFGRRFLRQQGMEGIFIYTGLASVYLVYVFLGKIAYVRRFYGTTVFYAFLISEGLLLFLKGGLYLYREAILSLV